MHRGVLAGTMSVASTYGERRQPDGIWPGSGQRPAQRLRPGRRLRRFSLARRRLRVLPVRCPLRRPGLPCRLRLRPDSWSPRTTSRATSWKRSMGRPGGERRQVRPGLVERSSDGNRQQRGSPTVGRCPASPDTTRLRAGWRTSGCVLQAGSGVPHEGGWTWTSTLARCVPQASASRQHPGFGRSTYEG